MTQKKWTRRKEYIIRSSKRIERRRKTEMISRMMKVGVADVRHYSRIAVPDVRRTTEHLNAHLCVCVFACWPHLCCCYCCCVACLFKHHSACSPAEQSDAFVCDDQRQLARLRQNAKRQRVFARPVMSVVNSCLWWDLGVGWSYLITSLVSDVGTASPAEK